MDHDNKKVFVTGVKRNSLIIENNLYEIIQKDCAKPIVSKIDHVDDNACNFIPKCGKFYIPKNKSKLKVSTVGNLRVVYEEDVLQTLPNELEKQQKLLLRKIKHGFAKDESTRSIAINLLKSNNPISRLSWQMLMNLNPEDKIHSSQYILWDGKCIRVNGSKGGKNKFICNYDVCRGKDKEVYGKTILTTSKLSNKKRTLLRDSLNVRFKPGPLSKKKHLDYSYQKHNVGEVKLVNLPKPGLHIQPTYGTPLEPTVKSFLQSLQDDNGTISAKWAEFAVSILGKVTKDVINIESENFVTFNLNYKYSKNHILMRQDLDSFHGKRNENLISEEFSPCTRYDESSLTLDVRGVVDGIVDAVEISLNQELMYPAFDEARDILTTSKSEISTQAKEKAKRRYGELDRLDVTVIRLSESHKKNLTDPCQQAFCSLGCICDSLECNYNLKDHCGRVDCMFKCKCDFSNYKITDSLDGDCSQLHPGLYYLDQKINGRLTKEEQKFHQTVILKDDKSILLKSNRRNWKATKKYGDFYNNMRLRSEIKNKKSLSVLLTKLNCRNMEPWCMVHNLYKCFCKGKFAESLISGISKNEQKHLTNEAYKEKDLPATDVFEKESIGVSITENFCPNTVRDAAVPSPCHCSRVLPYRGRNHGVKYYKITNKKIMEMEKNDKRLHSKMMNILNQSDVAENTEDVNEDNIEVYDIVEEVNGNNMEVNDIVEEVNGNTKKVIKNSAVVNISTEEVSEKSAEVNEKLEDVEVNDLVDVANVPFKLDELLFNILQEQQKLMNSMSTQINKVDFSNDINTRSKRLPNKTKLVQWLETSYKKYKEKLDKGFWKTSLSPPRSGKVALYPWNFILSRYRERKNLFLISKQKPFRIFMAVDLKHNFFSKCVNVNLIPRSHLDNYPVIIRNLLNDVKDQNETFCILYGLSLCWELVGSVTKVNENKQHESAPNVLEDLVDHSEHLLNQSEDGVAHSEDLVNQSNDAIAHSEDLVNQSKDAIAHSEDLVNLSKDAIAHSEDLVNQSKDAIAHSEDLVNQSKDAIAHSEDLVNQSKDAIAHSEDLVNQGEDVIALCEDGIAQSKDLVDQSQDLIDHSEDGIAHSEDSIALSEGLVGHCENSVGNSEDLVSPSDNETNIDNMTTILATVSKKNSLEIAQVSKWFVMTLENDFIEIQFFKKGFFIKYDSIVRAIIASRKFGQTVRLSSQKYNEGSNDPQFGLYAIPNMHDNCVFIGPYEKNEPLGIEALRKPVIVSSINKTRGMWITVNKIDNAEVINNPLFFMPSFNKRQDNVITFGQDEYADSTSHKTQSTSKENEQLASKKAKKSLIKISECIKPVKINKADCFKLPLKILTKPKTYRCIKKKSAIIQQRESHLDSSLENNTTNLQKETEIKNLESSNTSNKLELNEPLADIPSQIKISNIASLCGKKNRASKLANTNRSEKGMFVLKPEEINERLAFNYFRVLQPDEINDSSTVLPTIVSDSVRDESVDSAAIHSGGENSLDSATISPIVKDSLSYPANASLVEDLLSNPAGGSLVEDSHDFPAGVSSVEDSHDSTAICSVGENSLDSHAMSVAKKYLGTSEMSSPTPDVYIISDEEDSNNLSLTTSGKDVWISCTSIKNLGWIPGRRNDENKLSFRFPGFACTDYYEEEVAFNKINQVLTRKVYVPKKITMEWRVVEDAHDINMEDELTMDYLNADFVLTKQGLIHKNSLSFGGGKRTRKVSIDFDSSNKKKIIDDENEYSDIDNIEIEYIDLPEDDDDVLDDENRNDDKEVSVNDVKKVNNDVAVDVEKMQDEDNNLFEDKEKMDEYRKVFGCVPYIAFRSERDRRNSLQQ